MKKLIGAGLAGFLVLSLTGCGSEVLESQNAEVVNGKIYKKGADSPFSGTLSLRAGDLLGAQGGFGRLAAVAESKSTETSGISVGGRHLVNQERSALDFGMRLGAGTLCKAEVRDGSFEGKASCQAEKAERPTFEMSFKKGVLDGTLTYFKLRTGGSLVTTVTFNNGQPDGKQEMINTANQKVVYLANWKNGLMEGLEEAFDQETGNLIGHVNWVNNNPEGEVVGYAADGQTLTYKATFVSGRLDGIEESFSAKTGKLTRQTKWNHGAKQGIERAWNEQGELTMEQDYGGEESPADQPAATALSPKQLNACVDAWTVAFRKENGQDAMVTMDQIGEWEGWCKAGKKP